MCHKYSLWSPLELDAADFNGRIVLAVAAGDLVLAARLKFEDRNFRMAPLRDDLANNLHLRGVGPGQKFLFVGPHGQDVSKGYFPAYLAGQGFHLDGVPGRYPILFVSTSNDGVHRPSRDKSETLIIRMVSLHVNAKVGWWRHLVRGCAMSVNRRILPSWRYPMLRRRSKVPLCWCHQRAEEIISNITILLDTVVSRLYALGVKATQHPIERQMRQRLHHDVQRMQTIKDRMEELAGAYNEFQDLRDEGTTRKARIAILYGLIGDDNHNTHGDWVETAARQVTGSSDKTLRSELPLWEAMKEYLRYVPEARISEMEEFFSHIGYDEGNRQAIESALKRHPKEFHVRKQKREKFLSLKKSP
jgi:hypothetical protein